MKPREVVAKRSANHGKLAADEEFAIGLGGHREHGAVQVRIEAVRRGRRLRDKRRRHEREPCAKS
jgi:hypothetical protein